jgi:hypothetical protein
MPTAIKDVVNALAKLRQTTPEQIKSLIQTNFAQLITNDPWLEQARTKLSQEKTCAL